MYVLPAGINLTLNPPPTVTGAAANGDGTVTLTGTNWASDTLLYFDGLPSTIVSLDPVKGSSVVQPPPGINNQQAIVTAYNTDGQNSQLRTAFIASRLLLRKIACPGHRIHLSVFPARRLRKPPSTSQPPGSTSLPT